MTVHVAMVTMCVIMRIRAHTTMAAVMNIVTTTHSTAAVATLAQERVALGGGSTAVRGRGGVRVVVLEHRQLEVLFLDFLQVHQELRLENRAMKKVRCSMCVGAGV